MHAKGICTSDRVVDGDGSEMRAKKENYLFHAAQCNANSAILNLPVIYKRVI